MQRCEDVGDALRRSVGRHPRQSSRGSSGVVECVWPSHCNCKAKTKRQTTSCPSHDCAQCSCGLPAALALLVHQQHH